MNRKWQEQVASGEWQAESRGVHPVRPDVRARREAVFLDHAPIGVPTKGQPRLGKAGIGTTPIEHMLAVERSRRPAAEVGPNWLEIMTGHGRPDEEVVGAVQAEGW